VLGDYPALILDQATSDQWRNGGVILDGANEGGPVRVYSAAGDWLGVGRYDGDRGAWRPVKTVRAEAVA